MSEFDVTTKSKNGQWINKVEGAPELSRSYRDRDEAVDAGRLLAAELGGEHRVEESGLTGVITDPDPSSEPEPEPADPSAEAPFRE
ncbi:DUF2188 domain-containing protein [Leucobacter sp. USHLN153]|uniref:DUF2188 domain-containing protein n=1 Tax=Leucobacter sp. USHLN153 TaxID=3081268 RepID=UPI003019FC42